MKSSNRKNPGSHSTKSSESSTSDSVGPEQSVTKNTSSIAVQTDKFSNYDNLCNFSNMSMNEIKEQYLGTLQFLNRCHNFINGVFGNSSGEANTQKCFEFWVPEVPNYFNVLELFLERYKHFEVPPVLEGAFKEPIGKAKNRKTQMSQDEEQVIFDLQHFLPRGIGDGLTCVKRVGCVEECCRQSTSADSFRAVCGEKMNWQSNGGVQGKLPCKSKRRAISPSRLVKSEKTISKKSSHHELKSLSTTFEEIIKTCNEFEHKSIEYLLNNDVPLNEPTLSFPQRFEEKEDTFKLANLEQGDQDQHAYIRHQEPIVVPEISKTLPDKEVANFNSVGFNLLEYALKNCSPASSKLPPATPDRLSGPIGPIMPNVSEEKVPKLLLNLQAIGTQTKSRSLAVLNQATQSQSPKRVNEMFRKISRESVNNKCIDDAVSIDDFQDSDEFTRFVQFDDDDDDDDTLMDVFPCTEEKVCEDTLSSSESIIFTDEEYLRMNHDSDHVVIEEKELFAAWKPVSRNVKPPPIGRVVVPSEEDKPIKSNPLKLNDKDKSLADEKVLRTIGLFTETGDVRPGVINILEEKRRMSLAQNKEKNVKFRTQRKFDLEVRYNNHNMKVTDVTSEETFSDSSMAPDAASSVVSVSPCSTISDSDVVNAMPKDNRRKIKF